MSKTKSVRHAASRERRLNLWGSICSIVALAVTGVQFLGGLKTVQPAMPGLSGLLRLQAILLIGVAVAIAHGLLWALVERLFDWRFGAGGGSSLPYGWSAAVLSLTMTVPLITLPPLYDYLFQSAIVLPGHWLAGCLIVTFSALGHILLYGAKPIHFVGLRNILFPLGVTKWNRALAMELVYALIHFCSIALLYRIVVYSRIEPLTANTILPVVISGSMWLSGVAIFIFLKYPASLTESKWIEVRGVIHAAMLMLSLTGGMLM